MAPRRHKYCTRYATHACLSLSPCCLGLLAKAEINKDRQDIDETQEAGHDTKDDIFREDKA